MKIETHQTKNESIKEARMKVDTIQILMNRFTLSGDTIQDKLNRFIYLEK